MYRVVLSSLLLASFCASAAAQSGASINNEPHHKRLLYTNDLRLWEMTLPPGQATAPFQHEYDVATVVVGNGTLNIQRNGQPEAAAPNGRGAVIVADHTGMPSTYRIENMGTTDYRAFEIENMREDGKWPMVTPFSAPGSSVLKESRAFTVYDVVLKPGAPDVTHEHTGATIVIVFDGVLEQGGIGGTDPVRLQQTGQWLVIPRFQTHQLSAVGSADAHAIEVEVR